MICLGDHYPIPSRLLLILFSTSFILFQEFFLSLLTQRKMDVLSFLTPEQEMSMNCMDGLPDHSPYGSPNESFKGEEEQKISTTTKVDPVSSPSNKKCGCHCITFTCLMHALKNVFNDSTLQNNWPSRKARIEEILRNTHLNEKEIQKYVFIDGDVPYTRNLVFSDGENFTLILMCWNPQKESKIHDHPCDGCFVKTLRGGVKESRYHAEDIMENGAVKKVLKFDWEYVTSENEVTYMDNYLGYHKIGCASPDTVAMTLHLYTPPFKSCKVSLPCCSVYVLTLFVRFSHLLLILAYLWKLV